MIKIILFILITYIYLYNPLFVGIGMGPIKYLLFLSIIYSSFHFKQFVAFFKEYNKVCSIFFLIIIYVSFIVYTFSGNAASTSYSHFVWLLETTFIPFFLLHSFFATKSCYSIKILPFILNIGFFASLVSIFLLLNPSVNNYVLGNVIEKPYFTHFDWNRTFGISEGLTSSYGVIQGIFASISLFLLDSRHKKYFLYFVTLSISAVINARTGIIPVILTIVFKFVYSFNKKQYSYPFFVGLVSVALIFISRFASKKLEDTFNYVLIFFDATYEYFVHGRKMDYYTALDTFLQVPSSWLGIVFGEGKTLFGAAFNSSDIAYVNQIFTGGLIYLFGLFVVLFVIYKKIYQNFEYKYITILLFITALIINFKGVPFCISEPFSRFVMLIYSVIAYNKIFNKCIKLI